MVSKYNKMNNIKLNEQVSRVGGILFSISENLFLFPSEHRLLSGTASLGQPLCSLRKLIGITKNENKHNFL
jgi:hypothetical protein